jgi:hypothetical protein
VQIKIYQEFYHGIIDIANEGSHVKIADKYIIDVFIALLAFLFVSFYVCYSL